MKGFELISLLLLIPKTYSFGQQQQQLSRNSYWKVSTLVHFLLDFLFLNWIKTVKLEYFRYLQTGLWHVCAAVKTASSSIMLFIV